MERRKISAREVVSDIRSGMDDASLMKKYGLASEGLQSLYDKLVNKGFIDLGEMQRHLSGYLGTVFIPEAELATERDRLEKKSVEGKSASLVNAQEAARDIRAGIDDTILMKKYRLSPRGLNSLFEKLMSLGLLTHEDRDRRRLGTYDHTVDLREVKLSLRDALRQLGLSPAPSEVVEADAEPEQCLVNPTAKESAQKNTGPAQNVVDGNTQQDSPAEAGPLEIHWYDRTTILILFLIGIFPLGLYGLYRTARLSTLTKVLLLLGWLAVTGAWILFLSKRM